MLKPELLAPVGDLAMCHAAVHNGADAIYVGVPEWNARGRTIDFSISDLQEIIAFCHLRSVKVYFALNILIFDRELAQLSFDIAQWIALGPDAFIVQDIGLARLIHAIAPEQEIHASTQMTLASAEGVQLAGELGMRRCVLAREMSVQQIQRIREKIPAMELEVFVHGALCVSYSGQCLTSESFGGRSANRGQCAQSCRLPYKLLVDGKEKDLGGRDYLFSPRDLNALELLPRLQEIGVSSLKIEGRLKSPEYVAAVTAAYRKALDGTSPAAGQLEAIEALFSRGFFTGWLNGVHHQSLVDGFYSNHQGNCLGQVVRVDKNSVWVQSDVQCYPGDGILLVCPGSDQQIGTRLYGVQRQQNLMRLEFARDVVLHNVNNRYTVYRNDSPFVEKSMHRTYTEKEFFRRVPVYMELHAHTGSPLRLSLRDEEGHRAEVTGDDLLDVAHTPRDWNEKAFQTLSGLASTAYACVHLESILDPDVFLTEKMLRTLRQQAVAVLDQLRLRRPGLSISADRGSALLQQSVYNNSAARKAELTVLIRRSEQLDGLSDLPVSGVILDLDYGKDLAKALEKSRALGIRTGIATLRIHKAGENHTLRTIRDLMPDYILVRNLGALGYLRDCGIELQGDYGLNACNRLSVAWLRAQGLSALHPSWDLNQEQLLDLVRVCDANFMEIALHQYMPAFHMEHCVFAANLSQGERFPFCGKVCEQHQVEVVDHKGKRHFLESDAECRNTLFNGKPQSALKLLPALRQCGVNRYRLELLNETTAQTQRKARLLWEALQEKQSIADVLHHLGAEEKYGISEGQLFNGGQWKDRKKTARTVGSGARH